MNNVFVWLKTKKKERDKSLNRLSRVSSPLHLFFSFFFQHAFVHYSSFSLSLRGLKLLPCACIGLCVFSPHLCCCSIYKYIIVSCSSLQRKTQFHSSFVTRDIHTFFFSLVYPTFCLFRPPSDLLLLLLLLCLFLSLFLSSFFSAYTHQKKSAAKIMNENYSKKKKFEKHSLHPWTNNGLSSFVLRITASLFTHLDRNSDKNIHKKQHRVI